MTLWVNTNNYKCIKSLLRLFMLLFEYLIKAQRKFSKVLIFQVLFFYNIELFSQGEKLKEAGNST